MKAFTFFFLLLISISGICQNNNEITTYKNGSLYMEMYKENMDLVSRKPIGKDVWIYYEKFFKYYQIGFIAEDGQSSRMKLSYVAEYDNGDFLMEYQGDSYQVSDYIEREGIILIKCNKQTDGYIAVLVIEGLKESD